MAVKKNYYAVKRGRVPGIYKTWPECQKQVIGFAGASFKGFVTLSEAEEFMGMKDYDVKSDYRSADKSIRKISDKTEDRPEDKTGDKTEKKTEKKADTAESLLLESRQLGSAIAYVDGSYYHPNKEFACGAILFWDGEEHRFSEKFNDPGLVSMRNVAGEIKAAEIVMRYCLEHKIPKLIIYHDYEGIAKWPLLEWQANKEGTRNYRDFYQAVSEEVEITFRKVKGHSGDYWNDQVDQLAKSALGLYNK